MPVCSTSSWWPTSPSGWRIPRSTGSPSADTGAYGRIYDEVLADEALQGQTGRLLGDIDLAAHGGAAEVLRDIMPPAYLQEQTEDNIDRFTGFLRHESEDLEIYVSLKEPLERIEPVALGEVHQVIDELEIAEPGSSRLLADSPASPGRRVRRTAGPAIRWRTAGFCALSELADSGVPRAGIGSLARPGSGRSPD